MALSAGTGRVVVADEAGMLYLLDRAGHLEWSRRLPWPLVAVAASGEGQVVAGANDSGTISGFSPDGKHLWAISVGPGISSFDLGASGRQIAAARGQRGVLSVVAGRRPVTSFRCGHQVASVALAESHSNCIIAAGDSGAISLLDSDGVTQWRHNVSSRCGKVRLCTEAGIITLPAHGAGVETFTLSGEGAGAFDVGQAALAAAPAATPLGTLIGVLTDQNSVLLMDLEGFILWHRKFDADTVDFGITGDASLVVVRLGDGKLVAFEFEFPTGAPAAAESVAEVSGPLKEPEAPSEQEAAGVVGAPPAREAALLCARPLQGDTVPDRPQALFVSADGRFTVLALGNGHVAAFSQRGELVAEGHLDPPGKIRKKRSETSVAVWNPASLMGMELDRGETWSLPLGPRPARDLDCSASLDLIAFVDRADDLVLLKRGGEEVARRRIEPSPVRLMMAPGGKTIITEDGEGRFRFFDDRGRLMRKQRMAGGEQFHHVVLEDEFCVFGGSEGRLIVQDARGRVTWSGRAANRIARLEALEGAFAVHDEGGWCFLLKPDGEVLGEFHPPSGQCLLRSPSRGDPVLLHAEGKMLTAFQGHQKKLAVIWRFGCREEIRALEADRDGNFVAIVTAERLYFIRGDSQ